MRAADRNLRRTGATIDEGSGVARVVEDPEHVMMRQRREDQLSGDKQDQLLGYRYPQVAYEDTNENAPIARVRADLENLS